MIHIEKTGIKLLTALVIALVLVSMPSLVKTSFAEETVEDSFLKDEFDESDPFSQIDDTLPEEEPNTGSDNFHIGGYAELKTDIAFNKSHNKLSLLKPLVFTETEYRINENNKFTASGQAWYDACYHINSECPPSDQSLDDKESDIKLENLYFDSSLNDIVSLRIGRQIIAWGDSNWAGITDIINPRDMTRPGLIDLEDARLPIASTRLSAFYNGFSFDAVTIHEHPGNKISGIDSDFDYYAVLRQPGIYVEDKDNPKTGFQDTCFAFKAGKSFNGGDIAIVYGRTYGHDPVLSYQGINSLGQMEFVPEYEKHTTLGFTGNIVKGSALFKLEGCFRDNRALQRNDFLAQILSGIPANSVKTVSKKDQMEILAGIEYTGISHLTLLLEGVMTQTFDYEECLNTPEHEYKTYFQATYDMLNEALELELFWVYFHPGRGHILRLSSSYDLFDNVNLELGAVFYDAGNAEAVIYSYTEMDRLYFKFKYSF